MAQFNKMMIMIPVMLAARKLDSEDPGTVKLLRICYGVMQTICVLIVMYAYVTALKVSSNQIIYVPPAPQVCEIIIAFEQYKRALRCGLFICVVRACSASCVLDSPVYTPLYFCDLVYIAIRRPKCQEKVHRNCLQSSSDIDRTFVAGEHTVWDRSDVCPALLQGHDHGIGDPNRHGSTQFVGECVGQSHTDDRRRSEGFDTGKCHF